MLVVEGVELRDVRVASTRSRRRSARGAARGAGWGCRPAEDLPTQDGRGRGGWEPHGGEGDETSFACDPRLSRSSSSACTSKRSSTPNSCVCRLRLVGHRRVTEDADPACRTCTPHTVMALPPTPQQAMHAGVPPGKDIDYIIAVCIQLTFSLHVVEVLRGNLTLRQEIAILCLVHRQHVVLQRVRLAHQHHGVQRPAHKRRQLHISLSVHDG